MAYLVGKIIAENAYVLWKLSKEIWQNPELSFEETFAHDLLTQTLQEYGFVVKKNYFLPTAFRAEFDSGRDGSTVAVVCEYDALPGIGHACGHNLIAEIGVAVGIAVKFSMERDSSVCGKIIVLGTPAEEDGSGKIRLIEKGAFKDVDVAVMAHPQVTNRLYPLILDLAKLTVIFRVKEYTDPWDGHTAVDAAVSCYNNISIMRRRFNSKWRINGIISRCNAEEAEMLFCYRAPTRKEIYSLKKMLEKCIEAAASISGCSFICNFHEEEDKNECKGMIHNKTVAEVFGMHAKSLGVLFRDFDPRFTESAVSTDMGNVSHVVPSIQPEYSIGAAPHVNHTPGFAKVAGSLSAQEPTLVIAESLARTVVDLLSNRDLMNKAKFEFDLDCRGNENVVRSPGE